MAETETASTTADTAATLPAATTTAVAPAAVVVASGPPPPGSAAETPTAAAVAIGATPTITAVREPFPYTFAGVGPSMLARLLRRSPRCRRGRPVASRRADAGRPDRAFGHGRHAADRDHGRTGRFSRP